VLIVGEERTGMLVVVAVDTEVFPVAPVGRVVEMVAVPVVNGEEVEVVKGEFPAAFGADPAIKLEGALPVIVGCRQIPLHPAHQFVQLLLAFHRDRPWSPWLE